MAQEKVKSPAWERTVVLVKPDGVQRGLIGEVIGRMEKRGLKIIALKMIRPSLEHVDAHYPTDEAWIERLGHKGFTVFEEYGLDPKQYLGTDVKKEAGAMVRGWLVGYLTEAPIVAMIVEGVHAIDNVRKIAGNTLPSKAEIGTIRGDFSVDSPAAANIEGRAIKNIVHASETKEEAEHEIAHWFSVEDIHDYGRSDEKVMFNR